VVVVVKIGREYSIAIIIWFGCLCIIFLFCDLTSESGT